MSSSEWGFFLAAHPLETVLAALGLNALGLIALRAVLRGLRK